MKALYLMRHGETLFNVHHKNQGWCDSPLTERGHAQARIAGRHFRELGIRRCKLVCSSLHGGVASASSGPCGACAPARFALRWGLPRDHGVLRSHVPSTRV